MFLSALLATVAATLAGCGETRDPSTAVRVPFASGDSVIVASGPDSQRRIGPYRYLQGGGPYAKAVQAFGQPSSRGTDNPIESNLCTVRWRRLGLDLEFFRKGRRGCSPDNLGSWCGATVYTRQWQTKEGLRVGDREARMLGLYPRPRFSDLPPRPPFWSLIRDRVPAPIGEYDSLGVDVWGGYVVAIQLSGGCF